MSPLMKRCPRLVDGHVLDTETDAVALRAPDGTRRPLSTLEHELLRRADGTRELTELVSELFSVDVEAARLGPVKRLFESLEEAGAVEFVELAKPIRWSRRPWIRCLGTGTCCECQLVGPLEPEYVPRLMEMYEELAKDDAELAAQSPVRRGRVGDGPMLTFLNFPKGHCVFLDEERRCRIHARYGSAAKPHICQRFPLMLVEVEGELRAGPRPTCYGSQLAGESDAPDLHEPDSISVTRKLPDRAEGELDDALFHENLTLRWLAEPGQRVAEVLYRLAGLAPATKPRGEVNERFRNTLGQLASEMALHLDDYRRGLGETTFFEEIDVLLSSLETADVDECPELELPPALEDSVLRGIENAVFLRETQRYPSISLGVLALALGAYAAYWACDEEGVQDDFPAYIVTWNRLMMHSPAFTQLFPSPEAVESLLSCLR